MPRLTSTDKAQVVEKTLSLLPSLNSLEDHQALLAEGLNRLSFNQLAILQSAIELLIMNNCQDLAKTPSVEDVEELMRKEFLSNPDVKNFDF